MPESFFDNVVDFVSYPGDETTGELKEELKQDGIDPEKVVEGVKAVVKEGLERD